MRWIRSRVWDGYRWVCGYGVKYRWRYGIYTIIVVSETDLSGVSITRYVMSQIGTSLDLVSILQCWCLRGYALYYFYVPPCT